MLLRGSKLEWIYYLYIVGDGTRTICINSKILSQKGKKKSLISIVIYTLNYALLHDFPSIRLKGS